MAASAAESIAPERSRRALVLLARHEPSFRRTARRVSLGPEDADDALQRAVVILLTKAPAELGDRLAAWMHVVTRREALAVRRARERSTPSLAEEPAADQPGPDEQLERRERVAAARLLLGRLKPHERLALALQAHGYSYAEICGLTGWTYTKTNRCLAEGRARLRELGTMD